MSEAKMATPAEVLEREFMDRNTPLSEREHWARREIERLRALLVAPGGAHTHHCRKCAATYTPVGSSEDCPVCGCTHEEAMRIMASRVWEGPCPY